MLKIITFISFMLFIQAETYNYQERFLYRTEEDNICTKCLDHQIDLLDVEVFFDDRAKAQSTIEGKSLCYSWVSEKSSAIVAAHFTSYFDKNKGGTYDNIDFLQETKYIKIHDVTQKIIQNVTLIGIITFDDNIYDCEILGDGSVHSFGPTSTEPASKIKVNCKRNKREKLEDII